MGSTEKIKRIKPTGGRAIRLQLIPCPECGNSSQEMFHCLLKKLENNNNNKPQNAR